MRVVADLRQPVRREHIPHPGKHLNPEIYVASAPGATPWGTYAPISNFRT